MMNDLLHLLNNMQNEAPRQLFNLGQKSVSSHQFLDEVKTLSYQVSRSHHKRWALCYQATYSFTVALWAVLSAGCQPILLPNNQPGTVEKFASEFDGVLSDIENLQVCALPDVTDADLATTPKLSLDESQLVTLFTSGSTGTPKKISRSLKHLMNEIETLNALFNQDERQALVYSSVSHQHIYGLIFYILWPLCAGNVICHPVVEYPENIENILQTDLPVIMVSSPSLLSRLTQHVSHLKQLTIFSSGGLLKKRDAESVYQSLGVSPVEVLGSTETSGVAYRQQRCVEGESVWNPLPHVEIQIDQSTGCLKVRSPFFECTVAFVMGDLAEINHDGTFQLLERADRLAKIEGKRVSLVEVESLLKKESLVADAYALAMETHRQYLAVVVVLTPEGKSLLLEQGKHAINAELRTQLAKYLDRVLLPKQFRYVDEIPMNEQGKYVMSDLKKLFEKVV